MKSSTVNVAKRIEDQFQSFWTDWDQNDTVSARRIWSQTYPGVEFNVVHEGLTAELGNKDYIYQSGKWFKLEQPVKPRPKPFMYYCVFGEFKDGGFMVIQPINIPWHKTVIPAIKALIREREEVKRFSKYWSVDFAKHVDTVDDESFTKIKVYDKYKWEDEKFVLISNKESVNAQNN